MEVSEVQNNNLDPIDFYYMEKNLWNILQSILFQNAQKNCICMIFEMFLKRVSDVH